ncbi:MAG TPA: ABC transporter substrate-binding protein [Jatrophihabitans sp.]|jgi:peptide/nickel transport system substrate-binding protein|nr:ABC transporter substrate-binding protein [Jatrophihabitans sp.]
MPASDFTRRRFLGSAALAGGGALLLASCTNDGSSDRNGTTNPTASPSLPPLQGAELVTDTGSFPTKLSESPEFAQRVAAGKLPSVSERIGQDPLVLKPVGEVGKYGGELRRGMVGVDENNGGRFCSGPDSLLYWDYKFEKVVPNLAKGYEFSSDNKVMTLHLRRGMKWSDGSPFTADDVVFWYEDIDLNTDIGSGAGSLRTSAGQIQIKKADDFTVEYVCPVPYRVLPRMLAGSFDIGGLANCGFAGLGGFAPRHYLTKYLPKYGTEAGVTKAAKAAGFDTWQLYLLHLMDWAQNPALPMLSPWVTTRPATKAPWTLAANPYSIWVDTAGNQLPYIPTITIEDAGNTQVLNLHEVGGQYDFEDRSLALSSLPVLVKNQERSSYTVYRAPSNDMDAGFRVNLAYAKDKTIGDLLRETDFRRALSLGVDRDEINQIHFLGTSHPSANMVADSSPYFPGSEWRTKWATHDVARANKLLDGMGLSKKDSDGYRLRPDGKGRIELEALGNQSYTDFAAVAQTVVPQWKKIGIHLAVQTVDPTLLVQRILANEVMFQCIGAITTDVFINAGPILPVVGVSGAIGQPYAQWLTTDGKEGTKPPASLRIEDGWRMYQEGLTAPDARRIELGKEIYKLHADLVWGIGFVGQGLALYGLYCATNKLGNVPQRMVNDTIAITPAIARPMTFYYKS